MRPKLNRVISEMTERTSSISTPPLNGAPLPDTQSSTPTSRIAAKALRASRVRIAGTMSAKIIGLGLNLLLFRLLTPDDFGFFTAAVVITGLVTTISNFGLQAFLIQQPVIDDTTTNTTLFLDLALGAAMCAVVMTCGTVLQASFRDPVVAWVVKLYGVNMLIVSIGRTPLALLKRDLEFKHVTYSEIIFTLVSMTTKVGLAAAGAGALCFPLGDLLGHVVQNVYVWRVAGFRPRWSRLRANQARLIVRFGGATTLTSIGSYLANQTDKFLVTTRFSAAAAGLYNFGFTQASLIYNLLVASQAEVVFSLYARMRSDPLALRDMLVRILRAGNFVLLPVYTLGFALAPLIIEVVYGPRWLPAATVFRVFCVDNMLRSFVSNISGVQLAFGRAGDAARTKLLNGAIYVVILAGCSAWREPMVYALGYLLASVIAAVHNARANGKLIDLRLPMLLRASSGNVSLVAVCAGGAVALQPFLMEVPAIVRLATLAGAFVLAYLLLAICFLPQVVQDVRVFVLGRRTARTGAMREGQNPAVSVSPT